MVKLEVVGMKEIQAVFDVIDDMGISREDVEIPLTPRDPGGVSVVKGRRLRIVIPETVPAEEWCEGLEDLIRAAYGE
ncbi:hypothetical protein L6R50_04940 [Myxococcota bacterium]|nr:hypothetical protein [Myxococcota bacterium]